MQLWRNTRTTVHDRADQRAMRARGTRNACRAAAALLLCAQLTAWLTTVAYPMLRQTCWQAMLLELLPLAAFWALGRAAAKCAAAGLSARAESVKRDANAEDEASVRKRDGALVRAARRVLGGLLAKLGGGSSRAARRHWGAAGATGNAHSGASAWALVGVGLLLPCLIVDAYVCLTGLQDLCETALLPAWPRQTVAVVFAASAWLAAVLGRGKGGLYGLAQWKWAVAVLLMLGTVFLGAKPRLDALWPFWGRGVGVTALCALTGAGACWPMALMFALPREARLTKEASDTEGDGKAVRVKVRGRSDGGAFGGGAAIWGGIGWAFAMLAAGWMAVCLPMEGDISERWIAMARLGDGAGSSMLAMAGTLLLLTCGVTACAVFGELLGRVLMKGKGRGLAAGLVMAVGMGLGLWEGLGEVMAMAAAWRGALALLGIGLLAVSKMGQGAG